MSGMRCRTPFGDWLLTKHASLLRLLPAHDGPLHMSVVQHLWTSIEVTFAMRSFHVRSLQAWTLPSNTPWNPASVRLMGVCYPRWRVPIPDGESTPPRSFLPDPSYVHFTFSTASLDISLPPTHYIVISPQKASFLISKIMPLRFFNSKTKAYMKQFNV